MRYQVPQFIEVEDKIFGPLTIKQFIYLAGAGGVCLMCISLLPLLLAIPVAAPFVAAAIGLAFYKVNDRPLIVMLEHAFRYLVSSKLYLWKQHQPEVEEKAPEQVVIKQMGGVPQMTQGRLKDLAWSLNIKDKSRIDVDIEQPGHTM